MQTRDMWKTSKWKVVAGAATLSALGISGLALADQSTSPAQEAIKLRDQVQSADNVVSVTPLNLRLGGAEFGDLDSPFDDSTTGPSTSDSAGSASGNTPAGLDTLSGDTASGLDSVVDDSSPDDAASDDLIAPATTAPAATYTPAADESFQSASGSLGSVDDASGS